MPISMSEGCSHECSHECVRCMLYQIQPAREGGGALLNCHLANHLQLSCYWLAHAVQCTNSPSNPTQGTFTSCPNPTPLQGTCSGQCGSDYKGTLTAQCTGLNTWTPSVCCAIKNIPLASKSLSSISCTCHDSRARSFQLCMLLNTKKHNRHAAMAILLWMAFRCMLSKQVACLAKSACAADRATSTPMLLLGM